MKCKVKQIYLLFHKLLWNQLIFSSFCFYTYVIKLVKVPYNFHTLAILFRLHSRNCNKMRNEHRRVSTAFNQWLLQLSNYTQSHTLNWSATASENKEDQSLFESYLSIMLRIISQVTSVFCSLGAAVSIPFKRGSKSLTMLIFHSGDILERFQVNFANKQTKKSGD